MRSPVYTVVLLLNGVLALPVFGAGPDIYMVEAPFEAPRDVVISLARLEPQDVTTSVRPLQPRTTWGVFSPSEPAESSDASQHQHRHDSDGPCAACEAFERSRRQLMARAFDDLVAQLEAAEDYEEDLPSPDGGAKEEGALSDAALSDMDDRAPKRKSSIWDAPPIVIQPLASVGIRTRPEMTKSQQMPPDLASRRYQHYESATNYGGGQSKGWASKSYRWHAPSFYHRPLYFEQVNLERYGHYNRNWKLESILSAAHFFGHAAKLPLQLGAYQPCERVYTLGRYRPGNCNPNHRYMIPITWDGILKQGLTRTAMLWAVL